MALISESFHKEKLKKHNINIKTKYIVGNKILEKNTNDTHNDEIINGIRCEKTYYINKKMVHNEKIFDSRIEYTFLLNGKEDKEYTCKNCGAQGKLKDFFDGCPYCKTYYNIDYVEKDLGSKYHYDMVLKNPLYKIVTAIVDVVVSFILSFIFIKLTSRTFNDYDISKIFIYGTILSLILYYFFYIIDAYIVISPIKKYKSKQNKKQMEFWDRTKIDKKTFFNNLNYEVGKKYYATENIIDYDILDYINFKEYSIKGQVLVEVQAEVRIVYFENNRIKSKYMKDTYVMKRNKKGTLNLNNGDNMIKCDNCGASIDVKKGYCKYCKTEIKYLQDWIME